MKKFFRVTMLLLALSLVYSCSQSSLSSPKEEETLQNPQISEEDDTYRSLFAELDKIKVVDKSISQQELLTFSAPKNYSQAELRFFGTVWKWLKAHAKEVVVVASDAFGGVVGSAVSIGPGTIAGATVASAIAGVSIGGEVSITAADGVISGTVSVPLSTKVSSNNGQQYTIGEAHNLILRKAYNDGVISKKVSSDDIYQRLRVQIASDYGINLNQIPKENPVKFSTKALLDCIESPEVNSFDEAVKRVAKVVNLSEEKSRFILTTVVNNMLIKSNQGDLQSYNIKISEIIQASQLKEFDKTLLIDGTSVAVNSTIC